MQFIAADDASTLQNAGSIAAIVGAALALLLVIAGILRWWWRGHRVWSVKPRIFTRGEELYLGVVGLPASTRLVTAFVSDGQTSKRCGPADPRPDVSPEWLCNLRHEEPPLDASVKKYKVEIWVTRDRGSPRRVYKKKLRTPWSP